MLISRREKLLQSLRNADPRQAPELIAEAHLPAGDLHKVYFQLLQDMKAFRQQGAVEKAITYCKIIVRVGATLSDAEIEGQGFTELSKLYLYPPSNFERDIGSALKHLRKAQDALSGSNTNAAQQLLAETDFYIGDAKRETGKASQSIDLLREALAHFEKAAHRFKSLRLVEKADTAKQYWNDVQNSIEVLQKANGEPQLLTSSDPNALAELQQQLTESQAQHAATSRDLEQHQAALAELQTAHDTLQQQLADEQVGHQQTQATLVELESQHAATSRDLEQHQAALAELQTAHDTLQQQLADEQAGHQQTQATLVELESQHAATSRDLEQHQAALAELQTAHDTLQQQLAELQARYKALDGEHERTKVIVEKLGERNRELEKALGPIRDAKERLHLLRLSAHAPLWVAAARAELQTGRISRELMPLIERLKSVCPQEVERLTAEIEARSRKGAQIAFEPSGNAEPEHYLHWAVANARYLEQQGKGEAAVEILLKGWEAYLESQLRTSGKAAHA